MQQFFCATRPAVKLCCILTSKVRREMAVEGDEVFQPDLPLEPSANRTSSEMAPHPNQALGRHAQIS